MAFLRAVKKNEMPAGTVCELQIDGKTFALANVDGKFYAINNTCLHRGGPLGQGQIHDGRVVCPYHLWEFDCATGEYDYDPTRRVPTFGVKVEGDDILLEVPEHA